MAREALDLDDYVASNREYTGPSRTIRKGEKKRRAGFPTSRFPRAKASSASPRTPATELDYKRAYAKVAAAAGLGKETCVKIYGFEATGNGNYDIQAGRVSPTAKVISRSATISCSPPTVELVAKRGRIPGLGRWRKRQRRARAAAGQDRQGE
jgi:hypothetical protein